MKKPWMFFNALILLAILAVAGETETDRVQPQQDEPNYLVISTYQPAPGRSFNEAVEEITGWVRLLKNSEHLKSVRLFVHNWGAELSFYIIFEPNSWASIPEFQNTLTEGQPDLFDIPWHWQSHGDNILSEIPVE
jgi:hypothetical protein